MEAGAELEQRADATLDGHMTIRWLDDPGDQAQERRFARTVAADQPDRLARSDRDGDVGEGEHVLWLGTPAQHEQLFQAPGLVRADAEAARDSIDPDLARFHFIDGTAAARRTSPARTSTNAGSSFGSAVRSSMIPSLAACSAATMSRSQRISR